MCKFESKALRQTRSIDAENLYLSKRRSIHVWKWAREPLLGKDGRIHCRPQALALEVSTGRKILAQDSHNLRAGLDWTR